MTSSLSARLLGAAALATLAAAAPARATTLGDAIAYAYDTNPGLQAQRAALRALDENYVQARTGYGLQISAQASFTNYNFENSVAVGSANTQTDSQAVSLTQPIWTGGRVKARVSQAEATIRTGRENLRRFEYDLLTRVVTAYVNVRRDEQLLRIVQDTIQVLERQLSDTEAKFKVRTLTATDVAQSQARLSQQRSTLATVQGQLAVSRAQYLASVGQSPVDLAPPPPLEDLPPTIEKAFDAAEANNPQMLASVYTEMSSRARVVEAKAARLPTVAARLDFQRSPFQLFAPAQGINETRLGSVTITQPIYTSGQISSGIRQTVEENNRDRLTIDETRLQVTQQVSSAWEQLAASRKQATTFQDEVRADEFAFYGVRQEERFALRSTIEVLNAQLELTNAQQNLVRTRAQEYVGRVQLLAAVGVLDVRRFAPATARYDEAANLKRIRDIGATPLEAPVRILDGALAPQIAPQRPASIAIAHPGGAELPPPPDPDAPITSILSTLDKPPTLPPRPGPDRAGRPHAAHLRRAPRTLELSRRSVEPATAIGGADGAVNS